MDVTYSNSVVACARAEASRFAMLTPPPFKSYNQIVILTRKAKERIWALPLGTLCAGCVMPFLCISTFINYNQLKTF